MLTDYIAILILDSTGNRIFAKYYEAPHLCPQSSTSQAQSSFTTTPEPNPYRTVEEQKEFEAGLFNKTKGQQTDVLLYDNRLAVFKQATDCTLYVIGGTGENEILLYLVVVALKDCLDRLLKYTLVIFG